MSGVQRGLIGMSNQQNSSSSTSYNLFAPHLTNQNSSRNNTTSIGNSFMNPISDPKYSPQGNNSNTSIFNNSSKFGFGLNNNSTNNGMFGNATNNSNNPNNNIYNNNSNTNTIFNNINKNNTNNTNFPYGNNNIGINNNNNPFSPQQGNQNNIPFNNPQMSNNTRQIISNHVEISRGQTSVLGNNGVDPNLIANGLNNLGTRLRVEEIFELGEREAAKNERNFNERKLFELRGNEISEMHIRQLPPLQYTKDILQSLNDYQTCKVAIPDLWARCKLKKEELLKSMQLQKGQAKTLVKDLGFNNQLIAIYRSLKTLEHRVKQISEQRQQIAQKQRVLDPSVDDKCTHLKQQLLIVLKNQQLLQQLQKEIEPLIDYLQQTIRPLFKDHLTNSVSFQDPDSALLQIAANLLHKVNLLEKTAKDFEARQKTKMNEVEEGNALEQMCLYYHQLAQQLYSLSKKMNNTIVEAFGKSNHSSREECLQKVQEKAKETSKLKLEGYDQLKEIEIILRKRNPLRSYDKDQQLKI